MSKTFRRIAALAIGACAVTWIARAAHADPADGPSDYQILLGDPSLDQPVIAHNAAEANATFDRRASRILRYIGCKAEPTNLPDGGCSGIGSDEGCYQGILNSQFNGEGQGLDVLAKLAYNGTCGPDTDPELQTATARYQAIDNALAQLSIESGQVEGTNQPPTSFGPATISRFGDLDTGFKDLIPVLYLYKDKIPNSYGHVLSVLQNNTGINYDPLLGVTLGILGLPPATCPDGGVGFLGSCSQVPIAIPYCGNPPYWVASNLASGTTSAALTGVGIGAGLFTGGVLGGFIGGLLGDLALLPHLDSRRSPLMAA